MNYYEDKLVTGWYCEDMVVDNEIGPMLTVTEVARLLHVHSNTLRRWSDAGLIPTYRISRRGDRRFKQGDIKRFLADSNAYRNREKSWLKTK